MVQSILLYLGVRIGAILPFVPQWLPALQIVNDGPRLVRMAVEDRMENDFRQAGEIVLSLGEIDDIDEIERRVDSALSTVTLLNIQEL